MLSEIIASIRRLAAFEGVSLHHFNVKSVHYIVATKNGEYVAGIQALSDMWRGKHWYEIMAVYAPNARLGYLMLMAAMVKWERLIPDRLLTNASKSIIVRWYEKYKDTEYVVENVKRYPQSEGGPLDAGYVRPPGVNVPLEIHDENGEDYKWRVKAVEAFKSGFNKAYEDPQKNKSSHLTTILDLDLKQRNYSDLVSKIYTKDTSPYNSWVSRNKTKLKEVLEKNIDEGVVDELRKLYPALAEA